MASIIIEEDLEEERNKWVRHTAQNGLYFYFNKEVITYFMSLIQFLDLKKHILQTKMFYECR